MLALVIALAFPSLDRIAVSGTGFVRVESKAPFVVWGFNYDHDETGRLIEDYWEKEWPKVEADFREMKDLGANVVRIHLQTGKFLKSATEPNAEALARFAKLVKLAESTGLYLDVTGLGCYHKADVPKWYDDLDEAGRWDAQAVFWRAVAKVGKDSPAIFCYDVMNEPVVPGKRGPGEWLGGAFAGKHFVQFVTLDPKGRTRPAVAKAWVERMAKEIRSVDPKGLVTVGMVDWSLDRPGLTSGFVPKEVAGPLDFLCVHLYPESKKVPEAVETLKGFAALGKPVVIEETFPLKSGFPEFRTFLRETKPIAAGWVGFYWGKTRDECLKGKTIGDAITAEWLKVFMDEREFMTKR